MKIRALAFIAATLFAFGTGAQAAPLTGHDVRIKIKETFTNNVVLDLTRTVLDGPLELDETDDPFLGTGSFIDIGADFLTLSTNGTGATGNYELDIEILTSSFLTSGPFNVTANMSGFFQQLTARVLVSNLVWGDAVGSLTVTGLAVATAANVPAPGALALLGFGLLGLGARRRTA